MSTYGRETLKAVATLICTVEDSPVLAEDKQEKMIEQAADALLKGCVAYEIMEVVDEEDASVHSVYVSIASTPATVKLVSRQGAICRLDKLGEGLDELVRDINIVIASPVGG